ncbi:polyketide synthase dehydratase domain-containing protein [Actinomadura keratinilytica]
MPLPFAWSDVRLHATGGTALHVRAERTAAAPDGGGHTVSLLVTDPAGQPVLSAAGLEIRRTDAAHLRAAGATAPDHLYRFDFQPVDLPGTAPADDGTVVLGGTGELSQLLGGAPATPGTATSWPPPSARTGSSSTRPHPPRTAPARRPATPFSPPSPSSRSCWPRTPSPVPNWSG